MRPMAAAIAWLGTSFPCAYLISQNKSEALLLIFSAGIVITVFIGVVGAKKE